MRTLCFSALLTVLHCISVEAYSSGAPVVSGGYVCASMLPGHGVPVQTSAAPFTVSFGARTCYKAGDVVSVTLSATDGGTFKGFLVQARMGSTDNAVYGSFTTNGAGQKIGTCFSGITGNVITHTSGSRKISEQFTWTPSPTDNIDVTFTATFVRTQNTFWTGVTSSVLVYNANCDNGMAPMSTSTQSPHVSMSTEEDEMETNTTSTLNTTPTSTTAAPDMSGSTTTQTTTTASNIHSLSLLSLLVLSCIGILFI